MRLPDYHIHTARCGHASGAMEEYLQQALGLGLQEIGFADHAPMYWLDEAAGDAELAMPESGLAGYVAEVARLRAAYPAIEIKLGLEADYIPGHEDGLRRLLGQYPFDYVLGSVHFIDGWGFDNPAYMEHYQTMDLHRLYRRYFALVQQAAQSRLFDIMAHPDLIKKFGFAAGFDLHELYEETAGVFAAAGVCVEVNTAGLRAPVKEIYPAEAFLRACQKDGVPVTTGSDAHLPGQVGYDFDGAASLLTRTGYSATAIFSRRKYFLRHF